MLQSFVSALERKTLLDEIPSEMWLLDCFGILEQLHQGQAEMRQDRVARQFVCSRQNAHTGGGIIYIDLLLGGEHDPDAFDTSMKVLSDFIHDIVDTI